MSLYQMMNGVTQATFLILPMLGYHPETWPRFRDCFCNDADHPEYENKIHVYMRMGGSNGECWGEEDSEYGDPCTCPACKLNKMIEDTPGFVTRFNDGFDETYCTCVFEVPELWQSEYDLISSGGEGTLSEGYKQLIISTFPKIKDKLKAMFYPNGIEYPATVMVSTPADDDANSSTTTDGSSAP